MNTCHNTRIARAARAIAARLESTDKVVLSIPSDYADSKVFRITSYLCRYCGKYWIEYRADKKAIIRKQE